MQLARSRQRSARLSKKVSYMWHPRPRMGLDQSIAGLYTYSSARASRTPEDEYASRESFEQPLGPEAHGAASCHACARLSPPPGAPGPERLSLARSTQRRPREAPNPARSLPRPLHVGLAAASPAPRPLHTDPATASPAPRPHPTHLATASYLPRWLHVGLATVSIGPRSLDANLAAKSLTTVVRNTNLWRCGRGPAGWKG
jgi:hypothetical protein